MPKMKTKVAKKGSSLQEQENLKESCFKSHILTKKVLNKKEI